MKCAYLMVMVIISSLPVFPLCNGMRGKKACATEVLVQAAPSHAPNSSGVVIHRIPGCENFGVCCPFDLQTISQCQLDSCDKGIDSFTVPATPSDDGFCLLYIKEASLQSMPPELRLQMSYQYTCNRTSRPTGRDCEQDNNMPGHCCDKDTHKQSVTVEIMFVRLNMTVNMNRTCINCAGTNAGSPGNATVPENATVQFTCASNLPDSSPYWMFIKGGRTEAWCNPGYNHEKTTHWRLISERVSDNYDCTFEMPYVEQDDSGEYTCGIATTTELNEYRSFSSQPQMLSVDQNPSEPTDDNDSNLHVILAPTGTVIFISLATVVLFVVGVAKWRRPKKPPVGGATNSQPSPAGAANINESC